MGEEQAIDSGSAEFLADLNAVALLVQQAFFIDVVDVYEFNAQLTQAVAGQVGELNGIRRRKNTPTGGGKANFDRTHRNRILPVLFSGYIIENRELNSNLS